MLKELMMLNYSSISLGLAMLCAVVPAPAQQGATTDAVMRALDNQPHVDRIVPDDLAGLVKMSQASVIGKVVSLGELSSLNDVDRSGRVLGTDVFASYRIEVSEVIFNKRGADAPALSSLQTMTITQTVGKREAEAFLSRKDPAIVGREYLLFLWHRPGAASWSMLGWSLQFRKSATVLGGAEPASTFSNGRTVASREFFGLTVPIAAATGDSVTADWAGLVAEVKRLSTVSVKPR